MEKQKFFRNTRFDSKAIHAVDQAFRSIAPTKVTYPALDVTMRDATWSFDTFEEFIAAADQGQIRFAAANADRKFLVSFYYYLVSVTAPTRGNIEAVFAVIEAHAERCRIPAGDPQGDAKVYIGHGGDAQWRDLKDHLHEKHGYAIEAYEIGSRAGHTIRDILEEMLRESSFALLVMTGEDKTTDGKSLARQNVVHEAGLFQGKLGFSRAIILLEEGTDEFSNIHGLQQIRFSKGKIKESFGDVVAVLKRELG
jgi:predicted nucleotide-binding protein